MVAARELTEHATTPFSTVRAEHLGPELPTLYVPLSKIPRFGEKPVILEGGRGSGKTMVFKYYSFESKWNEHLDASTGKSTLLSKETILGFYYKTDDTVVPSMMGQSQPEERWRDAFTSYLGYRLLREVFNALSKLERSGTLDTGPTPKLVASSILGFGDEIFDWAHIAELARRRLYEVLEFANRPADLKFKSLPMLQAIRDLIAVLCEVPELSTKKFLFFIDEVENLNDVQQKVVTTLLLSSQHPIFYNLGCKVGGLASQETVLSQDVSDVHDFERVHLNHDPNSAEFKKLIREICRKRIRQFALHRGLSESAINDDISEWTGKFSIDEEVRYITGSDRAKPKREAPYRKEMRAELQRRGLRDADETAKDLGETDDEIINRLNLCLLLRGEAPHELVEELRKHQAGKASRYGDWYHNNAIGVLYLLARDYRRAVRYYGFETFCLLSNGNVRIFIELCHAAFTAALAREFDYATSRRLSPEEQDYAAQTVAGLYIEDIRQSRGYSDQLYHFVIALGQVFKILHGNVRQSEPEQNHISVKESELDPDLRKLLRAAVMWSVLTKDEPTKVKDADSADRHIDYIPNRVYAPYFEISPRKKRSINIKAPILKKLFSGDRKTATAAARAIIGDRKGVSPDDIRELADQATLTQYGGKE